MFGLAPAIHSAKTNPQESLKEGTRGAGGVRHRTEGIFAALQTCLAVILLAGSALMMQSVWRLLQVKPGFTVSHLLTMRLALSPKWRPARWAFARRFNNWCNELEALPGVETAGLTSLLPLGDSDSEIAFWLGNGPQPSPEQIKAAVFYVVSPDYPAVMQIPLLRGRVFSRAGQPRFHARGTD